MPPKDRREEKPIHSRRFDSKDRIFWARAIMGVVAGLSSGILGFVSPDAYKGVVSPDAYKGILLAISLYIVTYYLSRYVFARNLPTGQRRNYITLGIFSYIMLFLFTWILYNTLIVFPLG